MLDASFGEILVTAEKLKWVIDHGEKALRTSRRPTNLLMMYKYNEVRYEPLGVVAACVSWNYPFHNFSKWRRSSLLFAMFFIEYVPWISSFLVAMLSLGLWQRNTVVLKMKF